MTILFLKFGALVADCMGTCVLFSGYLLMCLSNRPQVSMVYRLINHAGCWKNTRRHSTRNFYGFTGTINHS